MPDDRDALSPATADDFADPPPLCAALSGPVWVHNTELMPAIVARRLVEHSERPGFVVMEKSPSVGAALDRSFEGLTRIRPAVLTLDSRVGHHAAR
jgi:hypothetical protein